MLIFENVRVILPDAVRDCCVAVEDGKIRGISSRAEAPDCERIDGGGLYLSPGFVDIHVHGGGGRETMECSPEAVAGMCRAHLLHGSTSMLPTLSAAPLETAFRAIDACRAAVEGGLAPNAAGIHLEGPFLSPAQAGAQLPENLLIPAETDYEPLLDRWKGLRLVGAAPELPGAPEFGLACRKRGITVSVAHSNATLEQVEAALPFGYTDITHLYSGCSTVVRRGGFRVPGVVEAGLLLDGVTVQAICDLCHLPEGLLRLIVKCCGPDRVSLVTDALCFAGTAMAEGQLCVQQNGQACIYEDGVLKMTDRTAFCGSAATADRLVRNIRSIGVSWPDALRMAAATPARVAGLANKGRIEPGYDADLLLFDEQVQIRGVWLKGRPVPETWNGKAGTERV